MATPEWKLRLKKVLFAAVKSRDKMQVAKSLRDSAKTAFQNGDRSLAVTLSEYALNFLEKSNQYMLAIMDWHFYLTGERASEHSKITQVPNIRFEEPWTELEAFIDKLGD